MSRSRRLSALICAAAIVLPLPGAADILDQFQKSVAAQSVSGNGAGTEDSRNIPPHAAKGVMGPPQGRLVVIDDKPRRLAPGAKIRDLNNRIVLPHSIQQPVNVRYTVDQYAHVHLIWLTPEKSEDGKKEDNEDKGEKAGEEDDGKTEAESNN